MARLTRKQLKELARIYQLVSAVPLPASGSQSTTIKAIASYANDMAIFTPMLKRLVSAFMDENCGVNEEPMFSVDECLEEINEWLEKRRSQDWQ